MRIHLPLHPHHFLSQPPALPSSPPIFQLGGDLVIIELQGELSWEGDNSGGAIGVLGLDRPDKPTLHLGEHHLLHGKISVLQKPYAVIRRATGDPADGINGLEGDASEEEDLEVDETTPAKKQRTSDTPKKIAGVDQDEDEDEPPLFPAEPNLFPSTPSAKHPPSSSSPFYPSSAPRDYSSELDPSSPAREWDTDFFGFQKDGIYDEEDEQEDEQGVARRAEVKKRKERKREKRRREDKERTRHYEVVGIVRKKVVFALRPEPIVTATILPE